MAIKPRKPRPAVDAAAIEAFGAAADQPGAGVSAPTAPEPQTATAPNAPKTTTSSEWPQGVPRSHLVRWPDPELAQLLADVSALEDRSQQKTALRALRRGLEAIRADHQA